MSSEGKKKTRSLTSTALLLVIVAIVAATTLTAAWFTLSDNTRVSLMLDITTGLYLRIDTIAHPSYEDYPTSLRFAKVNDAIMGEFGYDANVTPLMPVTTADGRNFYYEDGTYVPPSEGTFQEFTLHFIANRDMLVNLTTDDSRNGGDGTWLGSSYGEKVRQAMRISFTDPEDGHTVIYKFTEIGNTPLFDLYSEIDKPIRVRIWLEGTDPACTNALKNADYQMRLRFIGTDENGVPLS